MKTIFKSTILLAAVGLSLFTSCKDDNESNPTLTQPTQFVLNEIAEKGNIDLEKSKTITLTWSQPTPYNNFNTAMIPTYTVEVSPTGEFTTEFDINAEDNSGADYFSLDETYTNGKDVKVSTETLNRSLLQLCGWTEATVPDTQQLSFRVKSVIRDASFREYYPVYSNVIVMTAVPYYVELKPADPEIWWLIGADIADGSWGGEIGKCVIPMQTIEGIEYDKKTGQGEIQWIGYLGGNGFKLRGALDDGWAAQIGQNDGGYVKNDGGSGNITVSEPGLYKITLNTAEFDYVRTQAASFPDGLDTEVMKFSALEKAFKEATLKSEREHVTAYIWKNGSADGGTIYKTYNFPNPAGKFDANDYRITIDEPEDFEVIKALIENLGIEKGWKDYIDYLVEHKELYAINSKFANNEGYAKSIANDGVYVKK